MGVEAASRLELGSEQDIVRARQAVRRDERRHTRFGTRASRRGRPTAFRPPAARQAQCTATVRPWTGGLSCPARIRPQSAIGRDSPGSLRGGGK